MATAKVALGNGSRFVGVAEVALSWAGGSPHALPHRLRPVAAETAEALTVMAKVLETLEAVREQLSGTGLLEALQQTAAELRAVAARIRGILHECTLLDISRSLAGALEAFDQP